MAKKINLSFADGTTDVVYSAKNDRFFSYEKNRDDLHHIYGGKAYYTSGSGLSGAGYLLVPEEENDIIKWGNYIAGGGPKVKKVVGSYEPTDFDIYGFRHPIFGYAPIDRHRGIIPDYPFVLSDGETVAFLRDYQIPEALKNWQKIKETARKMSFKYVLFDSELTLTGEYEYRWGFYNPYHLSKVNALEFISLSYERADAEKSWNMLSAPIEYPYTHHKLSVSRIKEYRCGYIEPVMISMNSLGLIERVPNQDLRATEGELGIQKWVGDGDGVIWRRRGLSIQAFLELSWTEFLEKNPQMDSYEGHPSWVDFEGVFNVMDWFTMTKERRRSLLEDGIYAKIESYKELPPDTVVIPRVWEITRKIE